MKKVLSIIVVIFFIGVLGLVMARNVIVKTAIKKGIKDAAGLEVDIQKVNIGLFNSSAAISGITVYNHPVFADRLMLFIPQIYVKYDLAGLLKKNVHLEKLRIEVAELAVILNQNGKFNLSSLGLLLPEPSGGKPPAVNIDEFSIKIGKATYKGYLPSGSAKGSEFALNIDETFHNVTSPQELASSLIKKILSRIGIANIDQLDILGSSGQIKEQIQDAASKGTDALKSTVEEAGSTAKETIDQTKDELKKIFSQ